MTNPSMNDQTAPGVIIICCPKCCGSGRVPIPERMQEVLSLFEKHERLSAEQIQGLLKFRAGVTAYNNRLEYLRKLGALKRERHSKTYFYSLP